MTTDERLIKLETKFDEHEKQTGDKFAEYDKKLEGVEKLVIENHDMANSIKQLAEGMTGVNAKIDNLDEKVDRLENKDGENSKKILIWLGSLIGSAFVGYMISLLSQALI